MGPCREQGGQGAAQVEVKAGGQACPSPRLRAGQRGCGSVIHTGRLM